MHPSHRIPTLVALLVFCVRAGFASAADTKGAFAKRQTEVASVIEAFVSAWNSHDLETLTNLFTPGGNFKSPAGQGAQSRAAIRKLLAKEHREIFRESTLQAGNYRIVFPQTDAAVAIGSYTLSGIPVLFGIEVSREGTFKFQLKRRDGRWLIADARIAKE